MRFWLRFIPVFAALAPAAVHAQYGGSWDARAAEAQIVVLSNQARVQAGVGQLEWDPALAAAALEHCRRMVAEGQIGHQFTGELDVTGRAAQTGAHFSVIEENVAIAPTAERVHAAWMQSPGHRQNLLSADVDRVGVAVIPTRDGLYAVADYSRAVPSLRADQVEARVAELIRPSGVTVLADPRLSRAACAMDQGIPAGTGGQRPHFIMRWQGGDLEQLPDALLERLGTGLYHAAAVGSCTAQGTESFSAYRLAVLLY